MKSKRTFLNPFILISLALVFLQFGCENKRDGLVVEFPIVSEPIAITSGPKEHLFASYYGINSWSADQRYVTVLETPIKYRLPTENDPAMLGLVDLETNEFLPLAETRAWNFQQGCMAHWLGTFPNSRIIYNDMVDGKYVSIIMDVHTKRKIKTIPYPVAAVSPNGKKLSALISRGFALHARLMDMEETDRTLNCPYSFQRTTEYSWWISKRVKQDFSCLLMT